MAWQTLDEDILDLFADASSTRGFTRRASNQSSGPARPFDYGELSTARFGLRPSRRAKSEEAREMARYYFRQWKRAVMADPAKAARYRAMARAYARKGWVKLKADPVRHAKNKKWKREAHARHRDEYNARRNARTTPEMRKQWRESVKRRVARDAEAAAREKALAKGRRDRWYAKLKTDPVRYAKYLRRSRDYQRGKR